MKNKSPYTPRSQIVHALRMLWLRSRERAAALKEAHYTCKDCGVKQSKAKGKEQSVEVHHPKGIGNWNLLVEEIRAEILINPSQLEVLCPACHARRG